jgi:hypothetical protein
MIEEVLSMAGRLRPPGHDADAEDVVAWRWFMAITTGVIGMGLATHIALACGFIPSIYPGFASAADTQEIRQQLVQARAVDLEGRILAMRAMHCRTDNPTLKQLYLETLQKTIFEYHKLSKVTFPLPDCKEF